MALALVEPVSVLYSTFGLFGQAEIVKLTINLHSWGMGREEHDLVRVKVKIGLWNGAISRRTVKRISV